MACGRASTRNATIAVTARLPLTARPPEVAVKANSNAIANAAEASARISQASPKAHPTSNHDLIAGSSKATTTKQTEIGNRVMYGPSETTSKYTLITTGCS